MHPQSSSALAADRIAGPEAMLLIEAPAGHGKTHEAVGCATRLGDGLQRGQEILLLSHTNSARDEIRRRASRARLIAQTFDSLACEIVAMYAPRLGVEVPLRPGARHLGQPSFEEIRHLACHLLEEAPTVAADLAWRHPVILADEYQDSVRDHHRMLELIAAAGPVRRRLFGDDLQAIFDWEGELVSWSELAASNPTLTLDHGYRWEATPDLRDWIAAARSALLAGHPLPLRDAPAEVNVHHWEGTAPGPKQRGHCPDCLRLLRGLACPGRVAVLVRNREHAYGIAVKARHVAVLYEGGDLEAPLARLQEAHAATGDPRALALLLSEVLSEWGTGLTADLRRQLAAVCESDSVRLGKHKRVRALAEICELLYEDPSVAGWLRAFSLAIDRRDEIPWKPFRRDAAMLLSAVPPDADDHFLAAQAVAQARRTKEGARRRVMTIHKSKGREVDSVVIPYLSASSFPFSEEGARHLYVALTRAQREIHLLVPSHDPSPWVARVPRTD